MTPLYIENFINKPDELFEYCLTLPWIQAVEARQEYFMASSRIQYDYGKGSNIRSYYSEPFSPEIQKVLDKLNWVRMASHNMCFFNRYDSQKHALGWHSDNSPTMDSTHEISVISLGAEREIWWKPIGDKGEIPSSQKRLLKIGSLFIMPAGMQETHMHRIPKCDRECGTRISLTFRKHINVNS